MQLNIVLAGVGGQGILTVAHGVSMAAVRRGWHVKQAEVHGMSQRGGSVVSHLRVADHEIFSDLIPVGEADMVLATEPLEALRCAHYLSADGVIVTNTVPVVNIPDYGPVEALLDRIARRPRHVAIDANRLAGLAGASRAANVAMLGAGSVFTDFDPADLEAAVAELFAERGPSAVEVNRRAFQLGRKAARIYLEAMRRGADPAAVRKGLGQLPVRELEGEDPAACLAGLFPADRDELSAEETQAVDQILVSAQRQGRTHLYEHEVYAIVELAGAISPPRHVFVEHECPVTAETLAPLAGEKVVLKIVSPEIVHKSEAGAVRVVPNDVASVARQMRQLIADQRRRAALIDGVLVVEYVDHAGVGFGGELFVGIRATREFGPVIAAGLGGVDTEYLNANMRPGVAAAKALAAETSAEEFFELFRKTAAYEILSGRARGHRRIASDGELMRCFRSFLALARRFCTDRDGAGLELAELEVNPFAFRRETMVPLDGRGRLGAATKRPPARPLAKVGALLEPGAMVLVGASSKRQNFGRIILNNIKACGFPLEHFYAVKDQPMLDGVRCVRGIADLPEPVDLAIMAAGAADVPDFVQEVVDSGKVTSVIVIPGGLGEKEGTERIEQQVRRTIVASRSRPDGGPVFLGGNSLGIRSKPGRYDTFFIQPKKLDPRRGAPPRRVALVSQSGGFMISRLSNLELLDPAICVSIGNQIDLTASDMLRAVGSRDDIDAVGVYVEGFKDLDGLAFVRAVRDVSDAGKVVIFYKAGRTEAGRSATAGHTASIAGDYDVCQVAAEQAGAIVTDTFKEFEQVLELATFLHGKKVGGRRIAAIANSGAEAVGMADATRGPRYRVEMAELATPTVARLTRMAARFRLEGLVNIRNPIDVTPMATDAAYEECVRAMIEDPSVDAVVVSVVPVTPQLLSAEDEIGDPASLAHRLPQLFREYDKPLIVVVDAGSLCLPFSRAIRQRGVPVFRACDQAVRSLGRYLCHRAPAPAPEDSEFAGRAAALVSIADRPSTAPLPLSPTGGRSSG